MKREVYPEEMRTEERRKTLFEYLNKTSPQMKIAFGLTLVGVILNIIFLLNVMTNQGSSSFWFNISSVFVEERPYDDLRFTINNIDAPRFSLYAFFYDFKGTFHTGYWIMTTSLIVGGSGILTKNYEEARLQQKIFYTTYIGSLVIGLVKILITFYNLRIGYFELAIALMTFLVIYPLALLLPIQLLTYLKKESIFSMLPRKEDKRKLKVRNTINLILAGLATIVIALSYIGIDYLV
jgi:hypothetical protein